MSRDSSTAPPEMGVPYAEVIGDPVEHSKSPLIHSHWLERLGIPGEYRRTAVRPDQLGDVLRQRRQDRDWRGCNVTVPHKETVIAHLDRLDGSAAEVGAVNCIVPGAGGLTGYNSDVDGIAAALDGLALRGGKAALVGAGGAGRAALAYLSRRGIAEVAIVARDPAKAELLQALIPDARLHVGPFEAATALFATAAVVINASPLGMQGCPPMPEMLLGVLGEVPDATVFDMVYSPIDTQFLAAAQGRRINGLTMLVGQASRAFELFYGRYAPEPDPALLNLLTDSSAGDAQTERASNSSNS